MTVAREPVPFRDRWPLWAIDGALLGLFMIAVGVFAGLLYAPASPVAAHVPPEPWRGALMGLAMGLTAMGLIYSPWGARSGAHMNPALTLTFLRLGRIRPLDAAGYIAAQIVGGLVGAVAIGMLVGALFTAPPVSYAPTVPGPLGVGPAIAAEAAMTFVMMLVVLIASNHKRLARFTGALAGLLLFLYITFETPISGMSINPARTLASALPSGVFTHLWIYLVAPPAGMLAAAEVHRRLLRARRPHCCKLNHHHQGVCIHCGCDGPIDFDAHQDDEQ